MLTPFIKTHRTPVSSGDGHGEPSLELLTQLMQKVWDSQRETREDIREIKARLGRLEADIANNHGFLAEQSVLLDRFSDRLERVESRLEPRET